MNVGFNATGVGDIFTLMDELERLATADEVCRALKGVLGRFGIDYFLVSHLPPTRERLAPYAILKHWPAGWMSHYDRSGYCKQDPVVRRCFETIEPFEWSSAPVDLEVQPKGRQLMHEAAEFGMAEGYCVPIVDMNGFQAVVSLAGPRIAASPDERRALHLLGYYAHATSLRVGRMKQPTTAALSPRERDVLSYIASGEKLDEVAGKLKISRETVTTHLKRAKIKFGTRTLTHTVVEALRQRQLRP
ncbi:LuxR family transcriptional regulator [Aurantimonas sp. VKM B-3413]|uniref:helix-turn-helix transcriptional regulator n=1 Tax=Aurantimonas sp. VKM B-3413 TaxID=2779401 RepID=UPI001E44F11F|nr:LuxR family transcriptional regulator [Aurantimonas sp. VKM B-3413]